MVKFCLYCGKENVDVSRFCNFCGKELAAALPTGTCPTCGKVNPGYAAFCGSCGADIPQSPKAPASVLAPAYPQAQATPSQRTSTGKPCPYCGNSVSVFDYECPSCRKTLPSSVDYDGDDSNMSYSRSSGSGILTAAGILLIIAGVIAIGMGVLLAMGSSVAASVGVDVSGTLCICSALELLFGLGAIAGGVFSLKGEKFTLCILGAVVGLFSLGPIFIGSILSLIALILIAVSRDEFAD
jgi:hypothetical protein